MSNSTSLDDSIDGDDQDNLIDPIDELLVSYLDGELDEQQRLNLEDRLIAEESLRNRLSELQSGWEMLDLLPPADVTEDFARTTVELVAATESTVLQTQRRRRPWKNFRWMGMIVAIACMSGIVGYAVPTQLKHQRYQQKLELLPLAEHLDAYLINIDLNIVAQLASDPTWQESMQLAGEAGGIVLPVSLELQQREPEKRVDIIQNAQRDVRVTVSSNWERLRSLSDERLQQVAQRAEAIREMQNPGQILTTLQQYALWWQQLSPRTQDLIIKAEGDQKLAAIQQEVRRTSRRWVRNFALMLGEVDRIPIQQQLLTIANDRIREAKAAVEDLAMREKGKFGKEEQPLWWNMTPEQLLEFLANRPPFPSPPNTDQTPDDGRRIFLSLFGQLSDLELSMVEDLLSRQALAILYAESDSPEQRRETLTGWCMEIVQQMNPGNNSFESLLNRYELDKLDEQRREILDLSQPDRMINELRGRRGWGSRRPF